MKYGFSALLNEYQENVLNNAFQSDAFSIKKGDNRHGDMTNFEKDKLLKVQMPKKTNSGFFSLLNSAT